MRHCMSYPNANAGRMSVARNVSGAFCNAAVKRLRSNVGASSVSTPSENVTRPSAVPDGKRRAPRSTRVLLPHPIRCDPTPQRPFIDAETSIKTTIYSFTSVDEKTPLFITGRAKNSTKNNTSSVRAKLCSKPVFLNRLRGIVLRCTADSQGT